MRARLLACLLLLGAIPAFAQAPVRLDLHVTDNGTPVEGLTAADFDVFEDGVRQAITSLEQVRPPANGRARLYVVFVETTEAPRGALARFLDRLATDEDLVAVVTPETVASAITPGSKADAIRAIASGPARPSDPKERLYGQCYPDTRGTAGIADEMIARRRETLTFDALEALVARVGGLREERKAVIAVTDGWRLFRADRNLARRIERQRTSRSDPFGRQRRTTETAPVTPAVGGISMTECEADRNALARIDNSDRLRLAAERANRAAITFYPVTPDALTGGATLAAATPQESLRQLAAETDGYALLSASDLDAGLARIAADLSSYYLVTYTPTNGVIDGGFRQVGVRARQPGLRVRSRRGYRAPTAWELTGVDTEVSRAFAENPEDGDRSRFRLRASAWPRQAADGVRGVVWAVGELDPRLRRDVEWTAGAVAQLLVVDAAGEEVSSAPIDVDADTGTFSAMVGDGPLPPGEYALRAVVRAVQDGPLPVTDVARVLVPATPAALSDPVVWHRGPVTGPRFVVTADPRFTRNERVRVEIATAESGSATARLLDRQGSEMPVPVSVTERPDESGEFRWLVAEVTLAPLGIGSYAIEVTLDGAT
ncbi:MAG: VWA domain-containing protein, partial [Vicinamibacterales bacterium]